MSKRYTDYLANTNINTFFLTPTDKNDIYYMKYSLDSHKSWTQTVFLWKWHFSAIKWYFKYVYLNRQISISPKKVIPICNKQSKVDYTNYRTIRLLLDQIRLLSNCERIIENLIYKRPSNFLNFNTLIYSLQADTLKNTLMVWLILLRICGKLNMKVALAGCICRPAKDI